MAKKLLIAANWKMNLSPHQASVLTSRLAQKIVASRDVEIVLCPPTVDLYAVNRELDTKKFKLGSQDISEFEEGPHTGDNAASMLKGWVDYSIIGHSERRRDEAETDEVIAKKMAMAIRNGITPILCVGDTLLDREMGHAVRVVNDQLSVCLSLLTAEELGQIVITYEPVWAISSGDGKGNYAKPAEVAPMVTAMRNSIEELFGEGVGTSTLILYGGSVNPDNAKSYFEMPGIDGALVGGASLNYAQFCDIVASAVTVATS
ncbi:MAG: triose-phosphate isomerase [Candidatus Saccharimonadia bacterium]